MEEQRNKMKKLRFTNTNGKKNTWKNVDGASEKNNEGAQPAKQKFYLIRYIYVTILGHSVGYVCIAVSHGDAQSTNVLPSTD